MVLGQQKIKDHLNEQDLIRLHRELIVPSAVHDVLKGLSPLDDVAAYTIETMLAELPVDAALLGLSLSAAHIAHDLAGAHPVAGAMAIETARIVHEYGPVWMAHADGLLSEQDQASAQTLFTDRMAEDFESLASLLQSCGADMPQESDHAFLCDVLADHAQSCAAYTTAMAQGEDLGIIVESMDAPPPETARYTNNVVAFPRQPQPF